jgi:transcriptional regulator with XRE-family HTH domain
MQTEAGAQQCRELMKKLMDLRKTQGISQRELAKRMGITQTGVSNLETRQTDAYMSTLQRYARAVGYRLSLELEPDHPPGHPEQRQHIWRDDGEGGINCERCAERE